MDKFLEIVYSNQFADSEKGEMYEEFYKPFMDNIKKIVSDEIYSELEELFNDCSTINNRFYAVEGMKLAIGIMDGTYIPTI